MHELELTDGIHTLLHPVLSDVAARAFYRKESAQVPIGLDGRAAEVGSRGSLGRRLLTSDPDTETRLEFMREICALNRTTHCITFFAHWLHEDAEHPKLEESLSKARASPLYADLLTPEFVRELANLYDPDTIPRGPATYEFAAKLSGVYARYYHHVAPFDLAPLHRAWRSCSESDPRCHAHLDEVSRSGIGAR